MADYRIERQARFRLTRLRLIHLEVNMFWKLLNDQQEGIKDLAKAMWLVVGTDPTAPQITVGERNGDLSGPAIRSFGADNSGGEDQGWG